MSTLQATRTVAEVMTAVKRQFGDESGVQLEDADIIRWVNDAQDVIVAKTKVLKAKSTTPSVPGQTAYTFPSENIHQVESLHYDGMRILNMSFAEAEEYVFSADPTQAMSGFPSIWYEWAGSFTLWPTPDDVKSIDLYYTKRPARVTSSSDVLSVPDKFYQQVIQYVLQNAYEMDEDLANAQAKGQQFDQNINDFSEEDRTAQNMTYSTITVYND